MLKYSGFCYRKGLRARVTPKRLEGEDLPASERFASILIAFSCRRSALAFLLAVLPTFLASRVAPPIGAGFRQDHRYRWYRDCGIGLYSPDVRNCGEQASVRKVAIPNVLKVLLMFLLKSVDIRNRSPNPELELPRNNLLKRLFGWNTV